MTDHNKFPVYQKGHRISYAGLCWTQLDFSSVFLRFLLPRQVVFSKNFSKFTDLKIRHCPCFRNLQLFSRINVHTWSTTVANENIACNHTNPTNFQNNFDRLMLLIRADSQSSQNHFPIPFSVITE